MLGLLAYFGLVSEALSESRGKWLGDAILQFYTHCSRLADDCGGTKHYGQCRLVE